jgi:hypothetical protein
MALQEENQEMPSSIQKMNRTGHGSLLVLVFPEGLKLSF